MPAACLRYVQRPSAAWKGQSHTPHFAGNLSKQFVTGTEMLSDLKEPLFSEVRELSEPSIHTPDGTTHGKMGSLFNTH